MHKRLLLLLAFLLIGLFLPFSVFAQGEENQYGYEIAEQEIADYRFVTENCDTPSLECLVKNTTRFTMIELIYNIVGNPNIITDARIDEEEGASLPTQSLTAYNDNSGVIGNAFSLMGLMYDQPVAKTNRYVADVLNSANIATPAYAQGLGFAALDPILELWKKFRNIAYIFFIVIFIIIGFMIMFRAKIGGQTAVTAQQAIPSVIISLILVTFSYAIAGFMIDIMYLTMFLMIGLFEGNEGAGQEMINKNIFELMGFLFWDAGLEDFSTYDIGKNIIGTTLESVGGPAALGEIGGFVGGLTLTLVLAIAVLIGTVKLFFELLKSYASIILGVVLGPLVLMVGAIPGKNVFKPWLMSLIGNLAAFPTVLFTVIVFFEFVTPSQVVVNGVVQDLAPDVGGFMPPFLLNRGASGIMSSLVGLAMILALPEIVKKVKAALGAKDGIGMEIASKAIGQAKEGFPLGGRLAWGTTGAGVGAGAKVISNIPKAIVHGRPTDLFDGVGGAARGGISRGVQAATWTAQANGMRQPDILNPATNAIDRRFNTAALRRREALFQMYEDAAQHIDPKDAPIPIGGGAKPKK